MRTEIKWLMNAADIKENEAIRQKVLFYNIENPYSQLPLPERTKPIYETTYFSFKVQNVVDYIVEPTEERDIILNLQGRGEQRLSYDSIMCNKLELIFNGE